MSKRVVLFPGGKSLGHTFPGALLPSVVNFKEPFSSGASYNYLPNLYIIFFKRRVKSYLHIVIVRAY